MTEFQQASQVWSANLGLHLCKNPAGTWSFTGRVPADLLYINPDGSAPTDEQVIKAKSFGVRFSGLKTRVWSNPQDAAKVANDLGATLCKCSGCYPQKQEVL